MALVSDVLCWRRYRMYLTSLILCSTKRSSLLSSLSSFFFLSVNHSSGSSCPGTFFSHISTRAERVVLMRVWKVFALRRESRAWRDSWERPLGLLVRRVRRAWDSVMCEVDSGSPAAAEEEEVVVVVVVVAADFSFFVGRAEGGEAVEEFLRFGGIVVI